MSRLALALAPIVALGLALALGCERRERRPRRAGTPPPARRAPADAAPPEAPSGRAARPELPEAERARADECEEMLVNLLQLGYREAHGGAAAPPDVRKVYVKTIREQSWAAIDDCVRHTRAEVVRCLAAAQSRAAASACEAR